MMSVVDALTTSGEPVMLTSYVKVKLQKCVVDWVFGMSFDDHDENFITLHNRNFTKLILD